MATNRLIHNSPSLNGHGDILIYLTETFYVIYQLLPDGSEMYRGSVSATFDKHDAIFHARENSKLW